MSFDRNDDDGELPQLNNSRRRFLAGSAGALGGLALGAGLSSSALAFDDHGDNDEDDHADAPPDSPVQDEWEDDVDILNYARLLEFVEAQFYEQGLENISEDDLLDAEPLEAFGDPIQDRVYEDLETIRDHERDHAETLGAVIEDLGGDPIEEPETEFDTAVEVPAEFIATGAVVEDVGVSAYAGAAPFVEDDSVAVAALSIHSVEARHASFLRVLDDQVGFPTPYDQPRSRETTVGEVEDFLVDEMDEIMDESDD